MVHDALHDGIPAHRMPNNLRQRGGVGDIGRERRLVHIHSCANHRRVHELSSQLVLDENANHLAVAVVDVVGPFHLKAGRHLVQCQTDGEAGCHTDAEHLGGGKGIGVGHEAEQQVLAWLRLPSARHAAPMALKIGGDEGEAALRLLGVLLGVAVGAVGLRQLDVAEAGQWREVVFAHGKCLNGDVGQAERHF